MPGYGNPFTEFLNSQIGTQPFDSAPDDGSAEPYQPYPLAPMQSPMSGPMSPELPNTGIDQYAPEWGANAPIKFSGREEQPRGQAVPGRGGAPGQMGFLGAPTTGAANSEVVNYIREAARKRNIMEDIALEMANREGGTDKYEGNEGVFPTGKSYWAYQLHYGGAGTPYASYGNTAGMGNDFTERTGFRPGDPAGWQAAIDFALDHAAKYGWGAWYGRKAQSHRGLREIGEWEGINGR